MYYYLDYDWMCDMGESFLIFCFLFDVVYIYDELFVGYIGIDVDGVVVVLVWYMILYNKWGIYLQYYDNLYMFMLV